MKLYIDYGGTNFRYQLDDGEIISTLSKKINLKLFLDKIISQYSIDFIGISFAGQVDNGKIISAPSIGVKEFDVKRYIQDRYNINLEIGNDLNCASLAESGVRDSKVLALFYIGTGFGSGIVLEGRPLLGANSLGAELGHTVFRETPFVCGCGRSDCLELSCSGRALERWSKYYNLEATTLSELEKLKSYEAKIVYNNFFDGLKRAFHTTLNLIDPDFLILGGSVARNESKIVKFLQKEQQKVSFKNIRKNLKIEISQFENGSLVGAKLLEKFNSRI